MFLKAEMLAKIGAGNTVKNLMKKVWKVKKEKGAFIQKVNFQMQQNQHI